MSMHYLRKCRVCGLEAHTYEELELFCNSKRSHHGKANLCIDCNRKLSEEWRQDNKEYKRVYSKKWREENKEHVKEYARKYRDRLRKSRKVIDVRKEKGEIYYTLGVINLQKQEYEIRLWSAKRSLRKLQDAHEGLMKDLQMDLDRLNQLSDGWDLNLELLEMLMEEKENAE